MIVRMPWPRRVQILVIAEAEGLRKFGNYVNLIFIRDTGRL